MEVGQYVAMEYSKFTQSCNSFLKRGQSLPRILSRHRIVVYTSYPYPR